MKTSITAKVSFDSAMCCNLWIEDPHLSDFAIKLNESRRHFFVELFASSDFAPGGNAWRLGCSVINNLTRVLQEVES